MYVVDRKGAERELRGEPQAFWSPRVSPDGNRIVVQIGPSVNQGGLWLYDIASGSLTRLTADSSSVRGEWLRDATGSRIVYPDHVGRDSERVVSRPWDGSGAPTVLARSAQGYDHWAVSLGPVHGMSAIRRGLSATGSDIYLAPTDSLDKARPFITGPANEIMPRVSPNGRLLAYTTNVSGGQVEVYVTPMPEPGPRVPVSIGGGTEPAWSPDGSTLYYRSSSRMMAATIVEKPLAVTRRDTLFNDTYARQVANTTYDVMPNGRELLMLRGPQTQASMFMILNWPQLSRAKGAAQPH
jgi:serine/threonine-protein kinase